MGKQLTPGFAVQNGLQLTAEGFSPVLREIKEQYHDPFYHGRFESMFKEEVPAGVRSTKFYGKTGYIVTFWNTTDRDATFPLYGREITVAAKDVAVAEFVNG